MAKTETVAIKAGQAPALRQWTWATVMWPTHTAKGYYCQLANPTDVPIEASPSMAFGRNQLWALTQGGFLIGYFMQAAKGVSAFSPMSMLILRNNKRAASWEQQEAPEGLSIWQGAGALALLATWPIDQERWK